MANIKIKISFTKGQKIVLGSLLGILAGIIIVVSYFHFVFFQRFLPNTLIAGVSVAGRTKEEAKALFNRTNPQEKIVLTKDDENFDIATSELNLNYDLETTIDEVYNLKRGINPIENLTLPLVLSFKTVNVPFKFTYEKGELDKKISIITEQLAISAVAPSVYLESEKIVVNPGVPGEDIDKTALVAQIEKNLGNLDDSTIPITTKIVDTTLSPDDAEAFRKRAENLLNKTLILKFEEKLLEYKNNNLFILLDPLAGYKPVSLDTFAENINEQIKRPPQNPVFVFSEGKATEFKPAKDGIILDKNTFMVNFQSKLMELESSAATSVTYDIPTINTPPEYQTSDVNNLGIKELIGRGSSKFVGSIPSRIHNISLSSSKFNGVIVKPGETFSFNNVLGDVSALTGYQQAYVIKEGRTVLGDGGGVCQVSTTLFRALLNAGLPITERAAHSYRVSYYEQGSPVGIDATVYAPSPDLKFTNDTPGHILIQTIVDTGAKTLDFEIYGTKDGRVATITKPVISGTSAPPEDLYIDDPTLPAGTVKQIDWKAWGAKVSFNYKVEKDGQVVFEKTFASNYRPWQAKFLRGTGPAQQ